MNVSNISNSAVQPVQNTNQNAGKTTRIASMYINDLHSHLEGTSKTAAEVAKFRADNQKLNQDCFVFMGGDSYVGGNDKKNNLIVKLQNIIKPDANVYGNHEFDWRGTLGLSARTDNAKFPTLALNLVTKPNCALDDDFQAGRMAKSIIVEKNGEKFGLIGLLPSDLFNRVSQETKDYCKDIDILNLQDTIKAVQEEVNKFEKQGINKITVISHMGYDADVAIAKAVEGVDVIHGGHSHDILEELKPGVNYFTSKRGEPVIITQAGKNGHHVGILDIVYDDKGTIIQAKNTLKNIDNGSQSLLVKAAEMMFIGKPNEIGNIANDAKMMPEYALEENPICSFICDAYKKHTNADIAFINGGTIRASIAKGPITDAQISDMMPYYNEVSSYKLSEKDIVDTLNNAIAATRKYNRTGALQTAGLKYTIGKDDKVKDVYLVKDNGFEEKLDNVNPKADKFFTVAYNSFVGGGTEGLATLKAPEKTIKKFDMTETDMVIDYIKSFNGEPIKIEATGRIIKE